MAPVAATEPSRGTRIDRESWLIFAAACAVQTALASWLPLVADEAYYLYWSQHPALGYFDHPPAIAWWIAAGGGHPRLLGVILVPAAVVLLADAARRWGVARPARLLALVAWTPLTMAAVIVATPDTPALVAWCGVLWAIAARRDALVGLLLGLGLWSKSTTLLCIPGLIYVTGWRRALKWGVIAASVYLPHVGWSLDNRGLPWTFQAGRGWTGFHLAETVGGQLLVITPGLGLLAVWAWTRSLDTTGRTLRALGLPVLWVWLVASMVTRVEANWPAFAWPATAVLLLHRPHRWLGRARWIAGGLTLGAAITLAIGHAVMPVGSGALRDGERLRACYRAHTELPPVAARYQEKALLDLAGPPVPYLRARGHRASEYDRQRTPETPRCGFVYLANQEELDGRCTGVMRSARACGRDVTECLCGQKQKTPSESSEGVGAKGGSRTPTPYAGTGT